MCCNFVIFRQWGGQNTVYTVAKRRVWFPFLPFRCCGRQRCGENQEKSSGKFSLHPFFLSLQLLMNDNKTRSMLEDKNLPKYPALSMLNKIVLFLCVPIMLFAGKLNLNSCVFPLKGWEEKRKKKKGKKKRKEKETKQNKPLTAY